MEVVGRLKWWSNGGDGGGAGCWTERVLLWVDGRRGCFGKRNVMNGSCRDENMVGNKKCILAEPLLNPIFFCSNLNGGLAGYSSQ